MLSRHSVIMSRDFTNPTRITPAASDVDTQLQASAAAAKVHAPVCAPRAFCSTAGARYRAGWSGFAFPPGVRYLRNQSCKAAPRELGTDDVWLPVTNCFTQRQPIGHWFYYMRGCSDWAWHVGRTMLVNNRCDAALALQQRLAHNASQDIGREEAARRVAEHVKMHHSNGTAAGELADAAAALASRYLERSVPFSEAVSECARGIYEPETDECREALLKNPDPSRIRRARAFSYLAGHNMLDFHNMALATRLRGTPFELDTVQMWQQPQGGGSILWTTEIWDVRPFTRRTAFFYPRAGALDGSPCRPRPGFPQCRACKGSQLARNCLEETKAEAAVNCDRGEAS